MPNHDDGVRSQELIVQQLSQRLRDALRDGPRRIAHHELEWSPRLHGRPECLLGAFDLEWEQRRAIASPE